MENASAITLKQDLVSNVQRVKIVNSISMLKLKTHFQFRMDIIFGAGNFAIIKNGRKNGKYDYLLEDSEEFQDASEKEKINMLIEELEDRTLVYVLSDSVLVAAF